MDISESFIENLISEIGLEHPATVATEFEASLAVSMGGVPYFGDPTTNPALYESYRREGEEKYSIALMALKNKYWDSFVDYVTFGELKEEKLKLGEEQIIQKALDEVNRVDRDAISRLFMFSFLELIKGTKRQEQKVKYLKQFLSYWGRILLVTEHQEKLVQLLEVIESQ